MRAWQIGTFAYLDLRLAWMKIPDNEKDESSAIAQMFRMSVPDMRKANHRHKLTNRPRRKGK